MQRNMSILGQVGTFENNHPQNVELVLYISTGAEMQSDMFAGAIDVLDSMRIHS